MGASALNAQSITMIKYEKKVLANGLRVLVQEDFSTPLVAVNVAYNVGSRNDNPHRTGFAHLFEHLMFGGSKHVEDFDDYLQTAGGDANAFTNNDITNYYNILPAENIETALWLEADRMGYLTLNKKALEVQRKVVVEEFSETCLNQPYGDIWHHVSDLAYKEHPYRWPVIGLVPEHISEATLEDVSSFFKTHYTPANAVLVLAGNIKSVDGFALAEKWFGDLKGGDLPVVNIAPEPPQQEKRFKSVYADVPVDALYMVFHAPARMDDDFYALDLLTDVLADGRSSRFYQHLVKDTQLFSEIDAYISGTTDGNLLIMEGKPSKGISLEQAEAAIWAEINLLLNEGVAERELQKLKNRTECDLVFSEVNVLIKAQNLAYFELLGDPELINTEGAAYQAVTTSDLLTVAKSVLRETNCSVLYYHAKTASAN